VSSGATVICYWRWLLAVGLAGERYYILLHGLNWASEHLAALIPWEKFGAPRVQRRAPVPKAPKVVWAPKKDHAVEGLILALSCLGRGCFFVSVSAALMLLLMLFCYCYFASSFAGAIWEILNSPKQLICYFDAFNLCLNKIIHIEFEKMYINNVMSSHHPLIS
jgi:hypothetical protein